MADVNRTRGGSQQVSHSHNASTGRWEGERGGSEGSAVLQLSRDVFDAPHHTSAIQRNMHPRILNLDIMYVFFFCGMFEKAAHVRVQICSGCLCVCIRI